MAGHLRSPEKLRSDILKRLVSEGGCQVWPGAKFASSGYGLVSYNRKHHAVHRLLWELTFGPVTDGRVIDHKCRNKLCSNLEHLQEVTTQHNSHNLGIDSHVNATGVLNVVRRARGNSIRYNVKIATDGRTHHFGGYATLAEAKAVAIEKRRQMFANSFPLATNN